MKLANFILSAVVVAATVSGGCYKIEVESGKPLGQPAKGYDLKMHHGALVGIVEIGGNYPLDQICPQGWASVSSEQLILDVIIDRFVPIYTPQTISIVCADGGTYGVKMDTKTNTATVVSVQKKK